MLVRGGSGGSEIFRGFRDFQTLGLSVIITPSLSNNSVEVEITVHAAAPARHAIVLIVGGERVVVDELGVVRGHRLIAPP